MRHLSVSLRWLLDVARSDADSGLESLVRLRLHRLGISVRTQIIIPGVGEIDILLGDRLLIECDGRANHEREAQRHKDLVRDATAAALGYETLRFDYALIVHDWPRVEAAILTRVRTGAHLRAGESHDRSESPGHPSRIRRVGTRPSEPRPKDLGDPMVPFSGARAGTRSAQR